MIGISIARLFKKTFAIGASGTGSSASFKQLLRDLENPENTSSTLKMNQFSQCFDEIEAKSPDFIPSAINSIANFSKSTNFLISYEPKLHGYLSSYNKYSLIFILKAYSKRNAASEELLKSICQRAEQIINTFNAHDIDLFMFSLAKVHYQPLELFSKLNAQALKMLEFSNATQILGVIFSSSLAKNKDFLHLASPLLEAKRAELTYFQKIRLLKNYHECDLQLENIQSEILENIENLDIEEFAFLCCYLSEYQSLRAIYGEKALFSLKNRDFDKISPKALVLIVNAFHELGHGELACYLLLEKLCILVRQLEKHDYALIVYVCGIHQIQADGLWEELLSKVRSDLPSLIPKEVCVICYGLYKSVNLSQDLYSELVKKAISMEMKSKDIMKYVEIAGFYNDIHFLTYLKPKFLLFLNTFSEQKALICIEVFTKAGLSDKSFKSLIKQLKS